MVGKRCLCSVCVCVSGLLSCTLFAGKLVLVPVTAVLSMRPSFHHMEVDPLRAADGPPQTPAAPTPSSASASAAGQSDLERQQTQFLRKDKRSLSTRAQSYGGHLAALAEDEFVPLEAADPADAFGGVFA